MPPLHVRVFPAALLLEPRMTLIDAKSAGSYLKVHCKPASCTDAEATVRSKETAPPIGAAPDAKDKVTCA